MIAIRHTGLVTKDINKSLQFWNKFLKFKIFKKMDESGKLIDQIIRFINKYQLSKDRFEFQVLYGVPMEGRLESLIGMGYKVRVYIPYGPDWFDYSIRRLKENPKIINFVFKNFLAKKVNPNKN